MSSKASSTIGFERRFNPSLAYTDVADFIAESVGGDRDAASAEHGTHRRAEPSARSWARQQPLAEVACSPATATVLDVRAAGGVRARPRRRRDQHPGGRLVRDQGRLRARRGRARRALCGSENEARRAARGLNAVGLFELDGYLTGAEPSERLEPLTLDDLERMLGNGGV